VGDFFVPRAPGDKTNDNGFSLSIRAGTLVIKQLIIGSQYQYIFMQYIASLCSAAAVRRIYIHSDGGIPIGSQVIKRCISMQQLASLCIVHIYAMRKCITWMRMRTVLNLAENAVSAGHVRTQYQYWVHAAGGVRHVSWPAIL
jgi:hypothetical protein